MALRRSAVLFGAMLFGSLLVAPGAAHAAHVGCGQVITTNTTLDSDVGPCPGHGIIIRAENVTLDLNGHSVIGAPRPGTPVGSTVGILVDSVGRAQIRNGTVTGFGTGVHLIHGGGSTLERLFVRGNQSTGIEVTSFRNVVRGNVIEANGGDGVLVTGGNGNIIERNVIRDNGRSGFFLTHGGLNTRTGGTIVRSNSINGNGINGVTLSGLTGSASVTSNVITANRRNGVAIGDLASQHLVQGNQIMGNLANGVLIERTPGPPAPGSRILSNTALHNALFDLADENENCDSNIWSGNQFDTRNQACIN